MHFSMVFDAFQLSVMFELTCYFVLRWKILIVFVHQECIRGYDHSFPHMCLQFPITAIREIKILKKLHHENVIKLKEIVTSTGNLFCHLIL